ncbi:MAG TPA: CoA transferase [Casimicrobiaceae bacterium]|jgi:crotonobetainyl-CoA:carnitine CoA-transferase CaiB-like acyl-CoA transferase
MTERTQRHSPLAGLRVLEFGHIAAVPFCGMLLADLGADVVKVEAPQGDGLRTWPPIVEDAKGERFSLNFASLNRGKRSIVADLKNREQLARVRELCARADVIIENYRPGVLDRLGVGFADIAKLRKPIVYCSISGYGQRGRHAKRGAFDVVVQGASGLMSVTGEPDRPPVKCGVPVADFTAGLYAAYTIVAARSEALREQRAVHLDCSMLDCLLGISALQTSEYWGTGVAPARLGSAHPRNAPYQAFDASDAQIIIAAGNDDLWREVCEATGKQELLDDPRFAGISQRAKNQKELAAILQEALSTRTAREWLDELESRGVPSGPMNTFADILGDPELESSGLVQEMRVPVAGTTQTVAYPVQLDGSRVRAMRPPPRLGEHNDDVYAEWTSGDSDARVVR